jgi:rhodanese-related sulfurtransferase
MPAEPPSALTALLLPVLLCATVLAMAQASDDWSAKDRTFREKIAEINQKTGARQISVEDLQKKLAGGERLVIFDVRELAEMQVSALPGARLALPDEVQTLPLGGIPASAMVVTYCTVGYRSGKAAVVLEKRLGRPVYNLEGGLIAWFNHGGQVVDPAGRPVDRIDAWGPPWTSYVHPRNRGR